MLRQWIGCLLLGFLSISVWAANGSFSVEQANKDFDAINIRLSTQNLNAQSLTQAVDQLQNLQEQASGCETSAAKSLAEINLGQSKNTAAQTADAVYLLNKKEAIIRRAANCRLFVIRAKEAIIAYNDTIAQMKTSRILTRGVPVWRYFDGKEHLWQALRSSFQLKALYASSGMERFTGVLAGLLLIFLLLGGVSGYYLRRKSRLWLALHPASKSPVALISYVSSRFAMPLLLLVILSSYLTIMFWNGSALPSLVLLSYALTGYCVYRMLIRSLFYPSSLVDGVLLQPGEVAVSLFKRLDMLGWLALCGFIIYYVITKDHLSQALVHVARTVLLTLFALNVIWITTLVNRVPSIAKLHQGVNYLISTLLIALLAAILLAEWLGYHALSQHLLMSLSLTLVGLLVAWCAIYLISYVLGLFESTEHGWQQWLRWHLGLKPHDNLPELLIVKAMLSVMVLCALVIYVLSFWGLSPNHVDNLSHSLLSGFKLVDIHIEPLHIAIGFLTFSIVTLFGRWLCAFIAHHHQFDGEKDTQVAVAAITGYVMFGVAFLLALLIAGVNFTGLAIIAGALSVGIGLGLQDIVNNFVSGIVLLLEKPIRPGDRIIIGQTEGFVKKVRIRSTQISTLTKTDVIVPNADLIKNQVTNYMFRDRFWRVTIKAGVAYGSDTALVKKLLLEVAAAHEDVVQETPNEPGVFFTLFGDSSLSFELWCVIRDVNKKFQVLSDLHFMVDESFRQHGVTIAFPQRDVHVKSKV